MDSKESMSKLICYIACSIDGYIADSNCSVDWLPQGENGEDYGYYDFYGAISTTVMGSATYEQVLGFGPFPYPDKRNFVFSSRDLKTIPEVEIRSEDAVEYIKKLKKESKGNIWLVGGAKLSDHLTANELVDEFIITYIPVLLGSGIRLFNSESEMQKMKLKACRSYPDGLVQLHYIKEA
jgi:dihydrofolate reductase